MADRHGASLIVDSSASAIAAVDTSDATTASVSLSAVSKSIDISMTMRVIGVELGRSSVVVVGTVSGISGVDGLAFTSAETGVWEHALLVMDSSALASAISLLVWSNISSVSVAVVGSSIGLSASVTVPAGHGDSSEKSSNSVLHCFFVYNRI